MSEIYMAAYYYRILGVSPESSQDEIRSAYRRLVKEWHPDLNSTPGAVERFHLIQKAYETLGDSEARASYDAYVRRYTHRQGDVTVKPTGSQYRYSTRGRYPYNYRGPFQYASTATPEEEARSYTKEWFLIGLICVVMIGWPLTGPLWGPQLVKVWNVKSVAEITWVGVVVSYEYYVKDQERMTGDLENQLRFVPDETLSPEGMPLAIGDQFVLKYMPLARNVHIIDFNQPKANTLGRYTDLIWDRLQESALLENLAQGAMKGVFLYTLCDTLYQTLGVQGLATLYYGETTPDINPVHNQITFGILKQTPEFRRMVSEIRKVMMPGIVQAETSSPDPAKRSR
jgi:hypothetical protein